MANHGTRKKKKTHVLIGDDKITIRQRDEFRRLVNNANRKRERLAKRLVENFKQNPKFNNVRPDSIISNLEDKGFLTEKYSASMKQFRNKADFMAQLKGLRNVNKRGYNQGKIINLKHKMIDRIFTKTDNNELVKRFKKYSYEDIANIYTHYEWINSEIWDSDQKEDINGWNERIEHALNKYDEYTQGNKTKE